MRQYRADDDSQVVSSSAFQVTMGEPDHKLLFLSGIVLLQLQVDSDDGDDTRDYMRVRLWPGHKVSHILGWTASLGLSAIGAENNGFSLGGETVEVKVDPADGELYLESSLVTYGDDANLGRIAYNATILLEVNEPYISGRILWPSDHFFLRADALPQPFRITASVGGGEVATGLVTGGVTVDANNQSSMPYIIRGGALGMYVGQPLVVRVYHAGDDTFVRFGPNQMYIYNPASQVSGPDPVVLQPTHLHEQNVDHLFVQSEPIK